MQGHPAPYHNISYDISHGVPLQRVKPFFFLDMIIKDVPGGFPKSDLLGVTVALIHVAAQRLQRQLAS